MLSGNGSSNLVIFWAGFLSVHLEGFEQIS